MKKIRFALFAVAIIWFVAWSNDPIDDAANFIIGGLIPRSNIALGFWHTLGLVLLLTWGVLRSIVALRLQLLEHTAKQITAEKRSDFATQQDITFDPNQRSVIAAPTQSSTAS